MPGNMRFGRSPWESNSNEDSTDDDNQTDDEFVDQRSIRAPQLRLRYGRSFPSESGNSFDFTRFLRRAVSLNFYDTKCNLDKMFLN